MPSAVDVERVKVCIADEAKLWAEGVPKKVARAFRRTARELDSIVMTRAPGGVGSGLIDEGYDLKGFFIKSKSCNWGPMSGFVCDLPPFNKSGAAGVEWNSEHRVSYVARPDGYFYTKNPANVGKAPQVPLRISSPRKDAVVKQIEAQGGTWVADPLHRWGYGVACAADRSVVMEYFMYRTDGDTWALAHGDVLVLRAGRYASDFAEYDELGLLGPKVSWMMGRSLAIDHFETALSAYTSIQPVSAISEFRTILGLRNPYGPYPDALEYKNAVSGDYDLFAVWPRIGAWNTQQLRRASERLLPSWPLLVECDQKWLAVRSIAPGNIIIDVIPDHAEIADREDPNLGNYNNLVATAAAMLNSVVLQVYARGAATPEERRAWLLASPNRAFHGDEGGRPDVNKVEYTVLAFLPPESEAKLDLSSTEYGLIIKDHAEFVSLIALVAAHYQVVLNHGWMIDLAKSASNLPMLAGQLRDIFALSKTTPEDFWRFIDRFAAIDDRSAFPTTPSKLNRLLSDQHE